MTEDVNIGSPFKKIIHTCLSSAIEAMKAKITTEPPSTVTYTTVANHISTLVLESIDYVAKIINISSFGYANSTNGIYHVDGTINTRHHPNWLTMSPFNRKKVNDERSRLGLVNKHKGRRGVQVRNSSQSYPKADNQINQLEKEHANHKRTIASLKKHTDREDTNTEAEDIESDTGNSFGGKAKQTKKS